MVDEVLSNVGSQEMDPSGYQVFDLDDIEFHWKVPDLNMGAVYRPGMETPFLLFNLQRF